MGYLKQESQCDVVGEGWLDDGVDQKKAHKREQAQPRCILISEAKRLSPCFNTEARYASKLSGVISRAPFSLRAPSLKRFSCYLDKFNVKTFRDAICCYIFFSHLIVSHSAFFHLFSIPPLRPQSHRLRYFPEERPRRRVAMMIETSLSTLFKFR